MRTLYEQYPGQFDAAFALAEAWASIDGKLTEFKAEQENPSDNYTDTGTFDGYTAEAFELIKRLDARGFYIVRNPPKITGGE